MNDTREPLARHPLDILAEAFAARSPEEPAATDPVGILMEATEGVGS